MGLSMPWMDLSPGIFKALEALTFLGTWLNGGGALAVQQSWQAAAQAAERVQCWIQLAST